MVITADAISELPLDLVTRIDWLITLVQALGIFVVLYIVFNTINVLLNRKKNKKLEEIDGDIKEIKKLLKKKK